MLLSAKNIIEILAIKTKKNILEKNIVEITKETKIFTFKLSGETVDINLFRIGELTLQVKALADKPTKALCSLLFPSPSVGKELTMTSTGLLVHTISTQKINK